MGRIKKRWPLELDVGLLGSLEDALDDQQKTEPGLKRNEFLCRLLRRSLSHDAPVSAVSFTTAAPQTMAEFKGDVQRLGRLFENIQKAIIHRNRGLDRNDPESVARFQADDKTIQNFLKQCQAILTISKDRAWTLRGLSDVQITEARRFLATDLQERLAWAENRVAELKQLLDCDPADTIPRVNDEKNLHRLAFGIQRINALKCALSLLALGEVLAPIPPPTKGSGLAATKLTTPKKAAVSAPGKSDYEVN